MVFAVGSDSGGTVNRVQFWIVILPEGPNQCGSLSGYSAASGTHAQLLHPRESQGGEGCVYWTSEGRCSPFWKG